MPPLRLASLVLATALFPSIFAAEPGDVVRQALQDFLDQPNYTWGVPGTRGLPEADGEELELAVDGQHEKGGYTKVNFRGGPHIPRDEWPAAKPQPGFMDREEIMSPRWVFWTANGWQTLQQLPLSGPPPPRPTGSRGGTVLLSKSQRLGFRSFGIRRPDHDIAIVLPHLDEIEELRPGVFRATLDPDGAAKLMTPPRPPLFGILMPTVANARVRATFFVRGGQLARYELECDGTLTFAGWRKSGSYTVIRDLLNLGTTVIDVPPEVRRKFGETVRDEPDGP
jgi:hypothetical protein